MAAPNLLRIGHTFPVERTARQLVAVTGNMHIIKVQRKAQQWQQLPRKHHRPTHHRQQERIFVPQVARNLVRHFLQRGTALVLVEQKLGIIKHGLGFKAFGL